MTKTVNFVAPVMNGKPTTNFVVSFTRTKQKQPYLYQKYANIG